jgi:16S rRNA (adenine1518-N6/adenine1519-N6)-dimethyltransferase
MWIDIGAPDKKTAESLVLIGDPVTYPYDFLELKTGLAVARGFDDRIGSFIVAEVLREQVSGVCNVTVVEGDVLKAALPEFNKVVSIPPYYLSSRLVMWLLERKVECEVLILQREFADRLVAAVGSEEYGWLTVLACYRAEVEVFDLVPRAMFYPQPEVDSVVVRLKRWKSAPFRVNDEAFFERMVRWLFTQRNRKLGNAIKSLVKGGVEAPKGDAEELACSLLFRDRRVRELSPKNFGALANALTD